jgi:hypothetical protein
MPELIYEASNFPQSYGTNLVGLHTLTVSWSELIWAAISVGRAELLHITRHDRFSSFEMAYRTSILFANLCENANGHLKRSSAYEGLDPSEKGAISYFLGLTMTKAFSARMLNVPWLMHLDVYREDLQLVIGNGNSRPDLIGKNSNDEWIVMEAKGRTHGFDSAAIQRAKYQAGQVIEVSGVSPVLHVGLQVYFADGLMRLKVDDPKPHKKEPIKLPISTEKFIAGYYRPFIEWLSEGEMKSIHNIHYRQRNIPELDISIGINNSIFETQGNYIRNRIDQVTEQDYMIFVAPDGLVVSVGELWSRGNMMLEPQERA